MALPPASVLFARLETPPLARRKLRAILPSLLSTRLPFPVGDCVALFSARSASGFVAANVVRKSDLSAFLAAHGDGAGEPECVVAPGPALWRWACNMQPLPANAARAVLYCDKDRGESFVAVGIGRELHAIVPFRGGATAAPLHLSVAQAEWAASTERPTLLLAGSGAAELREALRSANMDASILVPAAPEAALANALAQPGLGDLDFRLGEFSHPGRLSSAIRPLQVASLAFFASAALWAAAADHSARAAERELSTAKKERDAALETLAGRRLSTRGSAALAEATEAAELRRDPSVPVPNAAEWFRPALVAARSTGVRFSHFELRGNALSASGMAPDVNAAHAFANAAATAGLRVSLPEEPVPISSERGGGFAFYVHPAGEGASR